MVQPIGMIHNNGVTEAERGMQRDLLDQIANIRERLMDKIDSIAKIKSDGYIDMIYYS